MAQKTFSWRVNRMGHIIEMLLYKEDHSREAMLAYLAKRGYPTTDYTLRQLLSTLVRIVWLVRVGEDVQINFAKRERIETINALCNSYDMCWAIDQELANARSS